jgi:hypothetical protein
MRRAIINIKGKGIREEGEEIDQPRVKIGAKVRAILVRHLNFRENY